jgi:hypothetical protein
VYRVKKLSTHKTWKLLGAAARINGNLGILLLRLRVHASQGASSIPSPLIFEAFDNIKRRRHDVHIYDLRHRSSVIAPRSAQSLARWTAVPWSLRFIGLQASCDSARASGDSSRISDSYIHGHCPAVIVDSGLYLSQRGMVAALQMNHLDLVASTPQ